MNFSRRRLQELAGLLTEQTEPSSDQGKTIFVLVGPPSVGKSTWIQGTFDEEPYIINRDDLVNKVASQLGWTYDDMFVTPPAEAELGDVDEKYGEVIPAPKWMTWTNALFSKVSDANDQVQSLFDSRVAGARGSDRDIVVDMTNMNANSRKRALQAAGKGYKKVAVVFEFEGAEEIIQKVSQNRAEAARRMGMHKTIPDSAFQAMFKAFSRPTTSEGFDEIVSVDNREMLRKLANDGKEL